MSSAKMHPGFNNLTSEQGGDRTNEFEIKKKKAAHALSINPAIWNQIGVLDYN